MSAFVLRLAALVFMLLDHIGYACSISVLRVIGRLSWPIFAFLLANGFKYTKNVYKYVLRLFLFAFLSETAYDLFFFNKICYFKLGRLPLPQFDNIYFTLFAGLCFLIINKYIKERLKKHYLLFSIPLLLIVAYVAAIVSVDYGALGILWIALFGMLDTENPKNILPISLGVLLLSSWRLLVKSITAALGVSFNGIFFANVFLPGGNVTFLDRVQPAAALSLILILLYNKKSGMPRSPKLRKLTQYAFYAFYPLHLVVLWLIFR